MLIDFSNNTGLSDSKIEDIKSLVLKPKQAASSNLEGAEHDLTGESETDGVELRGNGLTVLVSGCGITDDVQTLSRGTIRLTGPQSQRVAQLVSDGEEQKVKKEGGCCSVM